MHEVPSVWGTCVALGVLSAVHVMLLITPVKGAKGTRNNNNNNNNRVQYPLVAQVVCPPGCATCSSMNGCVTCQKGLFLFLHTDGMRQRGICVHACPSGYYGQRITRDYRKCQRCSLMHCESCYSLSYCSRCSPPYRAYQGTCTDTCPQGTHYATYTNNCVFQVDCAVGAWSSWGLCQRYGQTCGYKYGSQQRTRLVLQQPSDNADTCPETTEYQECRIQYRTCADLLNNKSEPVENSLLESLMEKWRRERKRRRRRKKIRTKKIKRIKKKDRNKKKRPDPPTRKNAHRTNQQNSRKRTTGNSRNKKKQRPLLPDVTTNQIEILMDADDMVK